MRLLRQNLLQDCKFPQRLLIILHCLSHHSIQTKKKQRHLRTTMQSLGALHKTKKQLNPKCIKPPRGQTYVNTYIVRNYAAVIRMLIQLNRTRDITPLSGKNWIIQPVCFHRHSTSRSSLIHAACSEIHGAVKTPSARGDRTRVASSSTARSKPPDCHPKGCPISDCIKEKHCVKLSHF